MKNLYFKLDRVQTNKYLTEYQRDVLPPRNGIFRTLLEGTGATGMIFFTPVVSDRIGDFYFTGPLPKGWSRRYDMAFIGTELCSAARPDESCPEGRAIAAMVETAERELGKHPDFLVWLCEKLGVMRVPTTLNIDSWCIPSFSRDALCVVFKVVTYGKRINGAITEECQEIKHSEYVALTEE
ncbi:TPA: hypothetical protein J1184_004968 [Escherichia coli]|nr:hypothetical protein [Escherichia coli]HBA8670023.1 hypothetical protein [Escherichia coli]HBA8710322.1 hypothetical protein [Escherichia coli]